MSYRHHFRVGEGDEVRLADRDPGSTAHIGDKIAAKAALDEDLSAIAELQYALFAEGRQSLLIVLQAPDAGGKDGTIRALAGGLNPQGCRVTSFKAPSTIERRHDFLWRIHPHAPRTGAVAIFNRSHYEDVLAVRVQKLAPKAVWKARYEHINAFERLLVDNKTRIIKFFLHISKEEQLKRFAKRLIDPAKNWKISEADYTARDQWDEYVGAFEDVFDRCSTADAPWYIIPADRKWYRNHVVARIVRETLEAMDMKRPQATVDIDDIRARYLKELEEA